MTKEGTDNLRQAGLSRRSFLAATGILGASAGMTALVGCSNEPKTRSASSSTAASGTASGTDNVSPIAPVSEPASWDNTVDVVVGGTGGGLVAALYAANNGASVAVFDPAGSWGGASKETDIVAIVGSKYQTQLYESLDLTEMGMPGMTLADVFDQQLGGHDEATMKAIMMATYLPQPGGSVSSAAGLSTASAEGASSSDIAASGPAVAQGHVETVQTLMDNQADMIDYIAPIIAQKGCVLGPVTEEGTTGLMFLCPVGSEAGGFVSRANYTIFESLYSACEDAGVNFSFSNGIQNLVADSSGRIVGIQSDDGKYTKAEKGVILATGGFAMNKDMLQRYCSTVAQGAFTTTAAINDDGRGIRMGLGAGGFIEGTDSTNCFDGGIPTDSYNHYLYKGDVQFARNVPSLFNIRGERVPWYSLNTIGFTEQSGILMGQPGGYGIAVADANYETIMNESTEPICRKPITKEMMAEAGANAERSKTVVDDDWRIGFQEGVDGGWIVTADSIEELAGKLGVNAANLKKGIDTWNTACAAGKDDMYHLDAQLLRPIEKAPFYAVKINGTILNTFCGLGVDWATGAVLDETATPIPGLYAAGVTAGGSSGSGSLGSTRNPGGGVGFAMGSAYAAAKAVLA